MRPKIHLFISYCHRDEEFRKELETHLAPLAREGIIETWHDRKISPGTPWEDSIDEKLEASDIYLFLVSPDFIASEYCYGKELAFALARHRRGESIVVPIVIRPADWKGTALAKIQGLPKDAIPVSTWPNRDEAWLDVINGIRKACNSILDKNTSLSGSAENFKTHTINDVLVGVVERIQQIVDSGTPISGIPSGLIDLDSCTDGFQLKQLVLIASAPQIDRFGLLINIIAHISTDVGLPCILVCAKYDEVTVGNRLLSNVANLPIRRLLNGQLNDDEWAHLSYALGKLNDAPLAIISYEGQSIEALINQINSAASQWGVAPIVVIDSLDHLTGTKAELVQSLRKYARKENKLILIGCGLDHPPYNRADKRPTLSDIGEWVLSNEHLDTIISVYLDQIYNPDTSLQGVAELIVHSQPLRSSATVRVTYRAESQSYATLTK